MYPFTCISSLGRRNTRSKARTPTQVVFEQLEGRALMSASPDLPLTGSLDAYSRLAESGTVNFREATTPARSSASPMAANARQSTFYADESLLQSFAAKPGARLDRRTSEMALVRSVGSVSPSEAATAKQALGATATQSFTGRPPKRWSPRPANATPDVLLVEDDPTSRLALATILRNRGLQVSTAATLAEGLKKLSSRPHDVIIDLNLPDGDGARLLQHVRKAKLPMRVTVTTAVTNPARLAGVRSLVPDQVISKPVNVEKLMRGLRAA